MDSADCRQHDACRFAAAESQNRCPEVLVLVVAPGDDFVIADEENPPPSDRLADRVPVLKLPCMISVYVGAFSPNGRTIALRATSSNFSSNGVCSKMAA